MDYQVLGVLAEPAVRVINVTPEALPDVLETRLLVLAPAEEETEEAAIMTAQAAEAAEAEAMEAEAEAD